MDESKTALIAGKSNLQAVAYAAAARGLIRQAARKVLTGTAKPARRAPPPPPPSYVATGRVSDFMGPYRPGPRGVPRAAGTYRWARREAAKLRRKGVDF